MDEQKALLIYKQMFQTNLKSAKRDSYLAFAKAVIEAESKTISEIDNRCSRKKMGEFNMLSCADIKGHSGDCCWVVMSEDMK
jgi:hypothetical protein